MNSKARLSSAAFFLLALSCSKQLSMEDDFVQSSDQHKQVETRFQASMSGPDESRTYIDGLSPLWESTDRISVFGSSQTNSEFSCLSASGRNAVFSGTTDAAGPYVAVYPYSADNEVYKDSVTVTVPSVQRLSGGRNVASGAMVSVATIPASGQSLSFKNVTALVKLTVAGDGITSILLSSDGAPLAGKATVSTATASVQSVADGSSTVTLFPQDSTFAPGDYYIAVIPGSSEGITLSVRRTADARRGEKSSLKTFTTRRAGILNLGTIASSSLDWAYRLYNRSDLDDYAADAANWSIEEDINVCADIDMEGRLWHPLDDRLSVGGSFEGNGHNIYNLVIEENTMQHVAFFGRYYKNIRNLTLGSRDGETYDGVSRVRNSYSADNTAWTYTAGCITWTAEGRQIENVRNFCSVTTTSSCTHKSRTAGVVTWIESAEAAIVKGCSNFGAITVEAGSGADDNVNCGGVVSGVNTNNVTIEDCRNYGKVTAAHIYMRSVGGVIGQNYSAAENLLIKDCANEGEVSIVTSQTHKHDAAVGGIMGKVICKEGATPVKMSGCVNNGRVYSNAVYYSGVGGIAGWASGADISACINNGHIENNSGSGRYQAVGGIAGICDSGYGLSSIKDCTNNGEVLYQGKSFGLTKNSKGGEIRGVNAGGIAGLVAGTGEVSGNTNNGNVTGINGYTGTSSYPKAYMFVGGIIGYDIGAITVFKGNITSSESVVSSRVTDASSTTNSYAVAGGIIGYQKNSTMGGGTSLARVEASYVSSKGLLYAGTISGWNKATISMCHYGGSVNGQEATAENTVGSGNAPVASAPASSSQTNEYDGDLGNVDTENGEWD